MEKFKRLLAAFIVRIIHQKLGTYIYFITKVLLPFLSPFAYRQIGYVARYDKYISSLLKKACFGPRTADL
jgi:Fe2+ transport system protein B